MTNIFETGKLANELAEKVSGQTIRQNPAMNENFMKRGREKSQEKFSRHNDMLSVLLAILKAVIIGIRENILIKMIT